jgi:hypothetical protein
MGMKLKIGSQFNEYLLYFINSPLFRNMIDEVNTMTINQITQGNLKSTICPLPPLAEQRRIVAKIDQLMARCDELEKLRVDRSIDGDVRSIGGVDRIWQRQSDRPIERIDVAGIIGECDRYMGSGDRRSRLLPILAHPRYFQNAISNLNCQPRKATRKTATGSTLLCRISSSKLCSNQSTDTKTSSSRYDARHV